MGGGAGGGGWGGRTTGDENIYPLCFKIPIIMEVLLDV